MDQYILSSDTLAEARGYTPLTECKPLSSGIAIKCCVVLAHLHRTGRIRGALTEEHFFVDPEGEVYLTLGALSGNLTDLQKCIELIEDYQAMGEPEPRFSSEPRTTVQQYEFKELEFILYNSICK